ncbi:MAG: hypothetical protein ACRCY8_02565 [Dermatophilaceae bacterium]
MPELDEEERVPELDEALRQWRGAVATGTAGDGWVVGPAAGGIRVPGSPAG